jgi:hypothetical protein
MLGEPPDQAQNGDEHAVRWLNSLEVLSRAECLRRLGE